MGSQKDVRHGDEAGEGVVVHDVPGEIPEKFVRFLLVHVEARRADLPLLDPVEEGFGFDQPAPQRPAARRRPSKGVESKPVEVKPAKGASVESKPVEVKSAAKK